MRGSNIPLPRCVCDDRIHPYPQPLACPRLPTPHLPSHSAALRALLNLYLPGMLTEALVSALPAELGAYVATSTEPIRFAWIFTPDRQPCASRLAVKEGGYDSAAFLQ